MQGALLSDADRARLVLDWRSAGGSGPDRPRNAGRGRRSAAGIAEARSRAILPTRRIALTNSSPPGSMAVGTTQNWVSSWPLKRLSQRWQVYLPTVSVLPVSVQVPSCEGEAAGGLPAPPIIFSTMARCSGGIFASSCSICWPACCMADLSILVSIRTSPFST